MALLLLIVGAALVVAGFSALSVPAGLVTAGMLCILGALALAAAQDRAPERAPDRAGVPE